MYSAEITEKRIVNGDLVVTVKYADGENEAVESFSATSNTEINRRIRNKLTQLDENILLKEALAIGVFTPSQDVVVEPSQADKAKQAWFRDFNRLDALTRLNTLGALRTNLVVELDTLREAVSAGFKKAYIADM